MPREPRIACISSGGGTGKTTLAVTAATWWATTRGPVVIVDTDPQQAKSATWWLDQTDTGPGPLSWAKATIAELVHHLDDLNSHTVIIDTAPRLDDAALQHVASLVDLILIPGSITEFATIAQTAATIRTHTATPVLAVITRTLTSSLTGTSAEEVLDVLRRQGIPIGGALRTNHDLAVAMATGRRPDQLTGADARHRIEEDTRALMLTVVNNLITSQARS